MERDFEITLEDMMAENAECRARGISVSCPELEFGNGDDGEEDPDAWLDDEEPDVDPEAE